MKNSKARRIKEIGASLVEYSLLVALIAVVSIASVRKFGQAARCNTCYNNAIYQQPSLAGTAGWDRASWLRFCEPIPNVSCQ